MKAEVYSKPTCPWCIKAKALLDSRGVPFVEHTLGQNGVTKESIEERIGGGYQVKTVPQIFLDGVHIGGYTELAKKLGV